MSVRVPNQDCEGCASKLKKALCKLKGVEEVEIEMGTKKNYSERASGGGEEGAEGDRESWEGRGAVAISGVLSLRASFDKYPAYIVNHYYDTYNNKSSVHTVFHGPSVYSVAVASDEAVVSLSIDDSPQACTIM